MKITKKKVQKRNLDFGKVIELCFKYARQIVRISSIVSFD